MLPQSHRSQSSSLPTLAAFSALFLLKLGLFFYYRCSISHVQERGLIAHDGTYQYFPVAPLQPVRTFIENTVHLQIDDSDEWASLIPGNGLVYLGEDKQPYTVSMVHQLRCLDIIRQEVLDLERNPEGLTSRPSALSDHCVQYMRQMVMCRGDLDFDPVGGTPKPQVFPDSYQCSDWNSLYRAIEQNQAAAGY